MLHDGNGLVYSPSDLIIFYQGEFASWMDRWYVERNQGNKANASVSNLPLGVDLDDVSCTPDERDEEMELIAAQGIEHEGAYFEMLAEQNLRVIDIRDTAKDQQVQATIDAMKDGWDVIFQARLQDDGFAGYADFLVRQSGESRLGDYHYEVLDTKLARSVKPYFIVQLCAYSEMLHAIQGILPQRFGVVLGTGEESYHSLHSFLYYFRSLKHTFLTFQKEFSHESFPHPGLSRTHGRWTTFAEEYLKSIDHLSQVANITASQIKKLEANGITTLKDLAKDQKDHVPRLPDPVFSRLKAQARLQKESRKTEKPQFEIRLADIDNPRQGLALLPPESQYDVYFDIEGYPLMRDGLEYLWGGVSCETGTPEFHDWWAHDQSQERRAFEQFIHWIHARWKSDPAMHVYHYAPYEVSAVSRLMGKHATREREVDDLLRNNVFVDLYKVVRQGLVIGTSGYSLKDIECLYMPPREGDVQTAGGSVVAYHHWRESGESQDWRKSPLLKQIRDYNQVDCESTRDLAKWLQRVQKDHGIEYIPPAAPKNSSPEKEVHASTLLAQQLLEEVVDGAISDAEQARVQQLLAYLLEYHWREAKPVFWRMFSRHEMTEQELIDDFDCLGGLERTAQPPMSVRRSQGYEYRFDPDQETKLHEGSRCMFAHDLGETTIERFDGDRGRVEILLANSRSQPPQRIGLIPSEHVRADVISNAIFRYVKAWSEGTILSSAVDDLLHRRPPRLKGHKQGKPIIPLDADTLQASVDAICRMKNTVLCIQGPPGSGKTHTAAHAILGLLRKGKRVGVTSNSHKAILNVLRACRKVMDESGEDYRIVKVGSTEDDPLIESGEIDNIEPSQISGILGNEPIVIGGTAWLFSRSELQGTFDCLIVDEAGQFSLANTVAVSLSASNLVLVGDQMQLAQTVQGTHPGDSGESALTYHLCDHATIPPDVGIFLGQTWRMHPGICEFISAAVYEDRLLSHPQTKTQRLNPNGQRIQQESGIIFLPVEHDGNSQGSEEEVSVIEQVVDDLLGCPVWDARKRKSRSLLLEDILIVAPFNMQVRMLKKRLGAEARIGSVDKFQGQEAHVVIISMCSSTLEDSPRGADFLFDPNRLNVAVSRAKTLAVIVGCPDLTTSRCHSVREMELANLYCRLVGYANGQH